MAKLPPGPLTRRDLVAAPIFYAVYLPFIPAILVGYFFWVGRLLLGRRAGVSATAQGPLSARWFQHRVGIRRDEPASRLLLALPGVSPLAVWLVFGPLLLAHRLSGYVPPAFRYPFSGAPSLRNQAAARQTFYDAAVERHLPEVAQLVILGAGFDTRALRLPVAARTRAYEVDTLGTLAVKRAALTRAGVDPAGVAFVAADFACGDWLDRLAAAGFAADKPTLFLWEGVTPYLDRAAVEETLRAIATTARGTVVAFDYFTTEVLQSRSLPARAVRAALRAGGEPLRFGIDSTPPVRERLGELLSVCGLALREQRTIGREAGVQRTWGGLAVAAVP